MNPIANRLLYMILLLLYIVKIYAISSMGPGAICKRFKKRGKRKHKEKRKLSTKKHQPCGEMLREKNKFAAAGVSTYRLCTNFTIIINMPLNMLNKPKERTGRRARTVTTRAHAASAEHAE
eukprot:scpid13664/ scgid6302/ 